MKFNVWFKRTKTFILMFIIVNLTTFEKFLLKYNKKKNSKKIYKIYNIIFNIKLNYIKMVVNIINSKL
jgi:hypothetical protein